MIEPPTDHKGASQHLLITCPHCLRGNLRIRRAHLGREVYCKYCGRRFSAQERSDPGTIAPSAQATSTESGEAALTEPDRLPGAMDQSELQRIHTALAEHAARCDTLLRQLVASQGELAASHVQLAEASGRLQDLQEQVDRLQVQLQSAEESSDELEGLRTENRRLQGEVDEL